MSEVAVNDDAAATAANSGNGPLLVVDDLHTTFSSDRGKVLAVRGVSLSLQRGRTLGVVGESGSGKSVLSRSIMGLMPSNAVRTGSVTYDGHEILNASPKEMRSYWGDQMSMVFQDPMTALNPVLRVEQQITESLHEHLDISKQQAKDTALALLTSVGIPEPARRLRMYPHEMSGGMRQRIMIAIALACGPKLLFADEPTTALDVTVQAQIMDLLKELQRETGTGLILITHDLGVVASVADRIAVMYAGRVMEQGDVDEIYARQANPYTVGLLESIPQIDQRVGRLPAIPGLPPNMLAVPPGCPYHLRCSMTVDACFDNPAPPFTEVAPGHRSMCWRAEEVYAGERVAR